MANKSSLQSSHRVLFERFVHHKKIGFDIFQSRLNDRFAHFAHIWTNLYDHIYFHILLPLTIIDLRYIFFLKK